MLNAAENESVYLIVSEAFRTREEQQKIMDDTVETYLKRGYPEFVAKKIAEKWVAENGYKYGFIYRYPKDKVHITGISNEPWHYRYVGVDAAQEMYEQDLCLEEYLKRVY